MPVVRYLVFVGGALLLLLFAADHYFPRATETSSVVEADRSVIRISSARKLPEKIVFDLTASPATAVPAAMDNQQDERSSREALAMMPQDRSPETQPIRAAPEPASAERVARHRRAVRSSRTDHRQFERRVAFDHREFFGGW